ncbi:MAG: serine/threonine protein kinase [Deltaproteobacteria bacterium]|nr:serine/threonine protein kinase [Deltaproteobacteria bacterium]
MADDTGTARNEVGRTTGVTKRERRPGAPAAPAATLGVAGGSPKDLLAPGTKVGRYEVIRLVGEGGMGTVYEALDARLERRVALKVLGPALKSKRKAAKRFAIEARAAARLVHPNVVGIFDFDMDCVIPYMAMEYLDGETLADALLRGPLAFNRMADVMLAVCAGVHAAHEAGIVHRDLKPGNIFLCTDWRGHETARVLDFGISKVGGVSSSGLTETGDIVGTSQYLSPEQAAGLRHVNEASDQYSLGVVMYECVTQQTPHQGLPIHTLLREVTLGHHTPARELRSDLPAALEAIIERAMSVRPKDRFPSVYELGRALFSFASSEGQRRFDDYYHAGFAASRPSRPGASRATPAVGPVPDEAATLRGEPGRPATWQAQTTRTSVRRMGGRRLTELADGPAAPSDRRSRRVLRSVVLGAVLAVMVLAGLLLVLRP